MPAKKKTDNKSSKEPAQEIDAEQKKAIVLGARKRTAGKAASKSNSAGFSMNDVDALLANAKPKKNKPAKSAVKKEAKPQKDDLLDVKIENRNHTAASVADILGFNPNDKNKPRDEDKVPPKLKKYYRALLDLRNHVSEGVELHTANTLKRSNKDDSGDLSGYGQHMADAGTDAFDRDFALSVLSTEQEALFEIEEAIQRIFDGNYGTCEITGKKIDKERLLAVPFTRYSLEGQKELESTRKTKAHRGGVFSDTDEVTAITEEDDDS